MGYPVKITFCLDAMERRDLMRKAMLVCREKIVHHKMMGVKFTDMAKKAGIPKQRIREVYKSVYLGERTLTRLLLAGYVKPDDLMGMNLNELQRYVLRELFQTNGIQYVDRQAS